MIRLSASTFLAAMVLCTVALITTASGLPLIG
jgi:hypothetical protein